MTLLLNSIIIGLLGYLIARVHRLQKTVDTAAGNAETTQAFPWEKPKGELIHAYPIESMKEQAQQAEQLEKEKAQWIH